MPRARGANAVMAVAFEDVYGTPETDGYYALPFVSAQIGEEQGLIASDLLGQGREPLPPSLDVANDEGDVVVPVDLRNFGFWLKGAFGGANSAGAVAATGTIVFSANPVNNSTITLNGVVWTFKAAGAAGPQTNIGVSLAATLTQLAIDLNASADGAIDDATYTVDATTLTVTHDTAGAASNAYTLAAGGTSHGTVSGATLSGGATAHTFTSGAADLPSSDIEIGFPDVPSYGLNFGSRVNSIKIAMQRSGLLNATVSVIAQGETTSAAPAQDDPPTQLAVVRFAQFQGVIKKGGVQLGDIVSAEWTYSNNLDKVEVIGRGDGRIEDAEPAYVAVTGNITSRFKDTVLLDQAQSQEPVELSFEWVLDASRKLVITVHSVYLPKAKRPVTGPKGVQASFNFKASKDPTLTKTVTLDLTNDVAGY